MTTEPTTDERLSALMARRPARPRAQQPAGAGPRRGTPPMPPRARRPPAHRSAAEPAVPLLVLPVDDQGNRWYHGLRNGAGNWLHSWSGARIAATGGPPCHIVVIRRHQQR